MNENFKKFLIIFVLLILILGVPAFFILRKKGAPTVSSPEPIVYEKPEEGKDEIENLIDSSRLIGGLPTSGEKIGVNFRGEDGNILIEYISFFDFYEKIKDDISFNINTYKVPLNIKTDIVNYYDISRKINLDNYINTLNNNGFAIVDNSFNVTNFYDIYDELYKREIPFLITSDFLIYYYQQTLKRIFKDIEENIFYANLWEINKFLFEKAKNRYEDSLRERGNVNDRVLEAQRLTAAYFATSLELLKPVENQINRKNDLSNKTLFTTFESDNYSFVLPEYLKVDVSREVELIRQSQLMAKSPVLLYERDYKNFVVPQEYQGHAKLNNFYLTTKWLSSNFPLYYKNQDCPNCYLDFDDWRISIITSSFIAKDIFDSYELKNKWARIYKTLAFFKGLRGDLTYVHYRDALVSVFGEDYKIEEIFADNNPDSIDNLSKFKNKILEYEFLDIEGGINKNSIIERNKLGVKMLTDFYWPNDYIFNKLSYPSVLEYQNGLPVNNMTSCNIRGVVNNVRCNGFSLDIIALVNERSLIGNDYYLQNSKYKNYQEELNSLRSQIVKLPNIWHYNNYWKTLNVIKEYLQNNKSLMPSFAQNNDWKRKELHTSIGAWVDLQLPPDQLKIYQKYQGQALIFDDNSFINYNYIEPNINLINEQLANVNMILEMFKLLKITEELRSVLVNLEDLKINLTQIKNIMIKELNSENLSKEDLRFISLLGMEFKLDKSETKIFKIEGYNGRTISYDIGKLKLMVLVSGGDDKKTFSVGPVFNYVESR